MASAASEAKTDQSKAVRKRSTMREGRRRGIDMAKLQLGSGHFLFAPVNVIVVDSLELEKIRTELGLLPFPLYPFHITIGILP